MTHDDQDLLDLLTFELKFLENEGYGRSPHTPWRCQSHLNPVKTVRSVLAAQIGFGGPPTSGSVF